jgi:hypothetical protein
VVIGIVAFVLGLPSASATITPATGSNVGGDVNIKDNQRPASATSSCGFPNSFGLPDPAATRGITKIEVIRQSDNVVVATVLLSNNPSAGPSSRWMSYGEQRGAYTVHTSYFKRLTGFPCYTTCPTNILSFTNDAALTSFPGAYRSCAPAAAVGAADTVPAPSPDVTINVNNGSVLTTPAGASGIAGAGGVAHLTAKLVDPNPGALSSPTSAATAQTPNDYVNRPIAGKNVTFQIDAPTGPSIVGTTDSAGNVAVDLDTSAVAVGTHNLSVTFGGGVGGLTDPQWKGSGATTPIKIAGESITTYTGAIEAFYDENYTASAKVVGATGGRPEAPTETVVSPAGRVGFKLDALPEVLEPITIDGDDDAVASHTFDAIQEPGTHSLVAEFKGDELFNSSKATTPFLIKKRVTSLVYSGSSEGRYGDDIVLSADLTDATPDSDDAGKGLANRDVTFQIGTATPITVKTDADGHASTTVPAFGDVGEYPVTTTYAGEPHYEAAADADPFAIVDRYTFKDDATDSFIDLNPGTHQFGYRSPTTNSGTITAPTMLSIFLPKSFSFTAPALTLPADFLHNMLEQAPGAPAQTIGGQTIGTPLSETSRDPARYPIPIGGFTLGDLINQIKAGNYPTDLDTCQILVGSTCERRLVIVNHRSANTVRIPIGVFDVKSGLFVALVNDGRNHLLSSFGTCLSDIVGCIGYPVGLSFLPALPPLPPLPPSPPSVP